MRAACGVSTHVANNSTPPLRDVTRRRSVSSQMEEEGEHHKEKRMEQFYSCVRTRQVHFCDCKAGECEMSQHSFLLTGWMYIASGE